jgi:hypothetical protein
VLPASRLLSIHRSSPCVGAFLVVTQITILGFGANAGAVEVDKYGQLNFRSDHKPILEELREAVPSSEKAIPRLYPTSNKIVVNSLYTVPYN